MKLPPFHPEAEREMNDEAMYYESKADGLGADFLAEVRHAAAAAQRNPSHGSPIGRHARRRPLGRFPHWLVYIPVDDGIRVLAVAHPSRRPGYWSDRV